MAEERGHIRERPAAIRRLRVAAPAARLPPEPSVGWLSWWSLLVAWVGWLLLGRVVVVASVGRLPWWSLLVAPVGWLPLEPILIAPSVGRLPPPEPIATSASTGRPLPELPSAGSLCL